MKLKIYSLICVFVGIIEGMDSNQNSVTKWDGEHYSKYSIPQNKVALELIDQINFNAYTGKQILDVGCGSGTITAKIAKRAQGATVVGIDSSSSMITEAQKTYSPEKYKNLTFKHMDATQLSTPFPVDLVVSFACFHWIKEQKDVLKKIYDNLNPSGQLIVSMSAKTEHSPVKKAMTDMMNTKWKPTLLQMAGEIFQQDVRGLESLLQQVGFKIISVELQKKEDCYSEDNFKKWVKGWIVGFPLVSAMPETEQDELIGNYMSCLKKYANSTSDDMINWTRYVLIAKASKQSQDNK